MSVEVYDFPLSFAQERFWLLNRMQPGNPAYNMPVPLGLEGYASALVIQQCLDEMSFRHEILVTLFKEGEGGPVQVVDPHTQLHLNVVDLTAIQNNEHMIRPLAEADMLYRFDLDQGPLLRLTLVRLSETRAVLLVNMHHIISDGWSVGILIREFGRLYQYFLEGGDPEEEPPFEDLPIQYGDYAVWQREQLEGAGFAKQLAYWVEHLQDLPDVHSFPTDRPRPAIQGIRGARLDFGISLELTNRLKALALGIPGATLYMTLMGAFATLLGRFGNQRVLAIGSPIANRAHKDIAGLIGCFANTLVYRVDLGGRPSFMDLLAQIKQTAFGAYANQELPFERLVEVLRPSRDLSHNPLFQVMLVLQNTPNETLHLPGLTMSNIEAEATTAKFDLTLTMTEQDGPLRGALEYNIDLFDHDTIARLAKTFAFLLEQIAQHPLKSVHQLDLMSKQERLALLQSWNAGYGVFPDNQTLPQLFSAMAARQPAAVAVGFIEQKIRYAELEARSTHLAQYLIRLGVRPGELVAVTVDRSIEMIVALIGIMKTGAVYVPLEPTAPAERQSFIIEDTAARYLVTRERMVEDLTHLQHPDRRMVFLDQIPVSTSDLPLPEFSADYTAYMIFTSGSTGKPKGVSVAHGHVHRLLTATQPWFKFDTQEVWTCFHSFAFDYSVWEIWGPLCTGGRLVMVSYDDSRSPSLFLDLMLREGVTLLSQTPSAFYPLAELILAKKISPARLPRTIVFGGEALSFPKLKPWFDAFGDQGPTLVNMYGITETCVHSTYQVVDHTLMLGGRSIIGEAIPDLSLYLLDPLMNPVPPGVIGELYLGEAAPARGYFRRPGLTATRFLPDPFTTRSGGRMYRSGDLARWMPMGKGRLEYIGRADHQVKIRGFRIELGEIEATLLNHPAVGEAVVLVEETADGGRLLSFLMVAPGHNQPDLGELRRHMGQTLPDYMIPSLFMFLPEMPQTGNGKIDRKLLFQLAQEQGPSASSAYVAPRTTEEELLTSLWADVLELEASTISTQADFFELGGHSLSATRLTALIRKTFGVELELKQVFAARTIAALAPMLPALRAQSEVLPAPVPVDRSTPLPLSFAQQRLWFLDKMEGPNSTYNMPLTIRLRGPLRVHALEQAFHMLLARQEVLRTSFPEHEGEPIQYIAPLTAYSLPLDDLAHLPLAEAEAMVEHLAHQNATFHFDMAKGPLFTAKLLRLGADYHFLLVNMHHVISDGWSLGVLVREIMAAYNLASGNEKAEPLAPTPIQYGDYSLWQRNWLQGKVLQQQIDYWVAELADAPPFLELPLKGLRPPQLTYNGADKSFFLPSRLTQTVKQFAADNHATLFLVLQAVFAELLARYSGGTQIVVGTPLANRRYLELEPLIGFFVNTLVLHNRLHPNQTVRERLASVRETALGAFAHQDVPFERLVEALNPPRDPARSPIFQVTFSFQNMPTNKVMLPDLDVKVLNQDYVAAKHELSLSMGENEGGIDGYLEYNTDLFSAEMIENMVGHFIRLLVGFTEHPDLPVGRLAMLSDKQRTTQLQTWNDSAVDLPLEESLVGLFDRFATQQPQALALLAGDEPMSYGVLAERSKALAAAMQEQGCGPEARVALVLDRDAHLIVALLATLRTGAAYVPFDLNLPEARFRYIMEDAQPELILTRRDHQGLLAQVPAAKVILVDEVIPAQAFNPPFYLPDLAFNMIYTSGSTGRPKGTVITHRALVNKVTALGRRFGIAPGYRHLVMSPLGFDPFAEQLFLPLAFGGTAVLVANPAQMEPKAFWDMVETLKIDTVDLVPSLLTHLMHELEQDPPAHRPQRLLLGGETLPAALWRRLRNLKLFGTVHNFYGPTEATIDAVSYQIPADFDGDVIPLGRPMDNYRLYVLDRVMALAPAQVAGELFIAGPGLARGYLNRPGLTAERFLPHPFASEPGERLYRTGDKAAWSAEGLLLFLGRVDDQVKIRGVRVEPGEIEARLGALPAVSNAAVVVVDGAAGKRLVAVLTVVDPQTTAQDLRKALAENLPESMIPSNFVIVAALPTMANGKVDRRALALLAHTEAETSGYRPPQTREEQTIAAIFSELLNVPQVGLDDNFFALGGHSLLGARLINRVRDQLGVELPLRVLFSNSTVALLAAEVAAIAEPSPMAALVALGRDWAPLSFSQQRLWFIYQLEGPSPVYNIPSVLPLHGPLDVAAFDRALCAAVQRHQVLRSRFEEREGLARQVVSPQPLHQLRLVDLSGMADVEKQVHVLVQRETAWAFALDREPLLRALIVRTASDKHLLVLNVHHIVFDGWSTAILVGELATAYGAALRGASSSLPAPAVQYGDYAAWQQDWLNGPVLAEKLDFWRKRLSGAPALLELPTDYPRPAEFSYRGATHTVLLDRATREALERLAEAHGATRFMVTLTAFYLLLARYTGRNDLLIGTPTANRDHAAVEGLIGFFVNTLVLRTQLNPALDVHQNLALVRFSTLDAFAHQDVPFDKLVEELNPERSLSYAPIFQVMFVYQAEENLQQGQLLPGITLGEITAAASTQAKFDLTLSITEHAGGWLASFDYATDLFDAETLVNMGRQLVHLVQAMATAPQTRLADLDLMAAGERADLLHSWAQTAPPCDTAALVPNRFRAQAARQPQTVAIADLKDPGQTLNYGELLARVERLAGRLQARGVRPGDRVGLSTERSADMVVAMTAVLFCGAAYVPLDPNYPLERLRHIVEGARLTQVIADESGSQTLQAEGLHLISPSLDEPASFHPVALYPSLPAYFLFTSGSTGKPKGMPISGLSVAQLTHWSEQTFEPEDWRGVLAATSINFDISVYEILVPLALGGRLVLARDVLQLVEVDADQVDLTLINTVPSAMASLLAQTSLPHGVTVVNLAGEALNRALADRVYAQPGVQRLYNLYGPSEDTTYSTGHLVPRTGRSVPPIGRPLPGTTALVVDRACRRVPTGVPGELLLGGMGLVSGYLGRPALTATQFIPAHSGEQGMRYYKTGDLVRLRHDGELVYMGRLDHQVKLRGFRIELGEIEVALESMAGVAKAVALVTPAAQKLVAFVQPAQDPLSRESLSAWLSDRLPGYMVPHLFVTLETWPLLPNGKVDRKRLAQLELNWTDEEFFEAPAGATETRLAEIFAQLLGIAQVGRATDFFKAGGHSLLGLQLVARVREAFGVELPLKTLFEVSKLSALAARIETLGGPQEALTIEPAPRDQVLSLSFAQMRLWFLDRMAPNGTTYNIPMALRLEGPLEPSALTNALQDMVDRHEVMRTHFGGQGADPHLIILPSLQVPQTLEDLSTLPEPEREATALTRARANAETRFDLNQGPLWRAELLRLGEQDHLFLLTMHHIISDGWSQGIVFEELVSGYRRHRWGEVSQLAPLRIQYADYAAWQHTYLKGERLQKQLGWWRNYLSGMPNFLALPTDNPRPAIMTTEGATHHFYIEEALAEQLTELSRSQGATLYMTLLGAFATLLYRYSDTKDLAIGSPVAGRSQADLEPLIGFFVNTLVQRIQFHQTPRFIDLLANLRRDVLGALTNQDIPFEKLVEELGVPRDLSHSPLFQVMFVLQNLPQKEHSVADLKITTLAAEHQTAKFDLTLAVSPTNHGLHAGFEYNTLLFNPQTIHRLAGHFTNLLHQLVRDPYQDPAQIDFKDAAERKQLLVTFNHHDRMPANLVFLEDFVAEHARTRGTAPALDDTMTRLTYREFNERANGLANQLVDLGIGPEALVGLHLRRTVDLAVALVAVLKAGAAFVPLDPSLPSDRIAFMIEDADPRLVLTNQTAPSTHAPTLMVEQWAGPTSSTPDVHADPANTAYVIFTSGTTGRPKGVAVTRANLANFIQLQAEMLHTGPDSRITQFTSIGFDASVLEVSACWSAGAMLQLLPKRYQTDPEGLIALLRAREITHAFLPPSLLAMIADPGDLPHLKTIACGGEALSSEVVRVWGANRRLLNLYGPTEGTVAATMAVTDPQDRIPPIGETLGHALAYLLDQRGEPMPLGVPGQLFIGGDCLARGYLGKPALTAERFVPDPFAGVPGARMYATGDLIRYLNGTKVMQFLGRVDHQVKIRGFRIELGEIEKTLQSYPGVENAVVLKHGDLMLGDRLVAYVAGISEAKIHLLRDHLAASLPEYMVPSLFLCLKQLPLNANDKIDRIALRNLPLQDPTDVWEAPLGENERRLAGIFSELLGFVQVGRHTHFFHSGGHSLLAVRLTTRIREQLGADIPLQVLFKKPTVAELALEVAKAVSQLSVPAIVAVDAETGPLSYAQQRLWFLYQLEGPSAVYNIPLALHLEGAIAVQAMEAALDRVTRRHRVLRTRLMSQNGTAIQVASNDPIPFQLLDLGQTAWAPQALRQKVEALCARPFFLDREMPIRATVLRTAANRHILVLVVHHIAFDGWSAKILLQELSETYAALVTGLALEPPVAALQYADYAIWQREWLRGPVLDQKVAYWKDALDGAPALLELPYDQTRPARLSYRGDHHSFAIGAQTAEALKTLARETGATRFMATLAAFKLMLARYSGRDDILVGTPVANRDRTEIERLIGFFVNTLVLRSQVDQRGSARDLLTQVRDTTLAAFAHQDLPFDTLVEILSPERSLSFAPIFQVMFSYHSADSLPGAPNLPGLTLLDQGDQEAPFAKFDLSLTMTETPDGYSATFDYATDLFERATIQAMAQQLTLILELTSQYPDQALATLPLLAEADRKRVLSTLAGTPWQATPNQLVHQRFEAMAKAQPERLALVLLGGTETRLTYGALYQRVLQGATALQTAGVRPGDRVGLSMDRSENMVVAMFACLYSGAAYVPMDPAYPLERLQHIAATAQPRLILVDDQGSATLAGSGLPLHHLDNTVGKLGMQGCIAEPQLPAYLLFTSGSTGKPKGMAVACASVGQLTDWAAQTFHEEDFNGVLAATSINFDISVFEILVTLALGGHLVLARNVLALAEERLPHISLVNTVPSAMESLLSRMPLPASVKVVTLAGEALSRSLVQRLYSVPTVERVYNLYGPSEDTTFSTGALLTQTEHREPTIGKPLPGTYATVLDPYGRQLPTGVPGQLFLGGAGLVSGYLSNGAQTAARFVPNPYGEDGDRLYATGDLVRQGHDGALYFMGRIDFQVKLRGFRIELGEIESVLEEQAGVARAVVLVAKVGTEEHLCAYIEATDPAVCSRKRLLDALARRLPPYMVPSQWVTLSQWPLLPNGKIDRKRLAARDLDLSGDEPMEAPMSAIERDLAEIFRDVLGLEQVGRHTHFFKAGGHSLLALKLVGEIEQRLGITLQLAEIFRAQTLAGIATCIEQGSQASPLVPLNRQQGSQPLYAFHAAGGGVAVYEALAQRLNRPVFGIQSPWLQDPDRHFEPATYYRDALMAHQPKGPLHLLGWSMGGLIAHRVAELLEEKGRDVSLVMLDTYVFEPANPPLEERMLAFALEQGVTQDRLAGLTMPQDRSEERLLDLLSDLVGSEQGPNRAQLLHLWRAREKHLNWAAINPPSRTLVNSHLLAVAGGNAHGTWTGAAKPGVVETIAGDHYGVLQGDLLDTWSAVLQGGP